MTEREYIDATNLAKIRACRSILRDCLPDEGQQTKWDETAMAALYAWEQQLTRRVKPEPDPDGALMGTDGPPVPS